MQWVCDEFRVGRNPADTPFPVEDRNNLLERYNTHKQWLDDAEIMAKSAMPKEFTEKMKWAYWKGTLINFLKSQPGRHGVPLSYVICENDTPIIRDNANFLDDYVDQAPLNGHAFTSDASKVHSYIARLLTGNPVAEQKILPHKDTSNGRIDCNALKEYYEGVGANAKAVLSAEADIQDMYYSGEKKPMMWWDEFEVRLTNAFAAIDKEANRVVHTDEMKLRLLNKKIKANFLITMKTNIEMQMNITPMTMTYQNALSNYRNVVNQRFPHESSTRKINRRIQTTGGCGQGGSLNICIMFSYIYTLISQLH